MYKSIGIKFLFLFLCSSVAQAQSVLPNLPCGQQTRDWIKANFFDTKIRTSSINYNSARQYMYAYVDNPDSIVTCVYGGYRHPYKPDTKPTNPVQLTPPSDWKTSLLTGATLMINCEHTVPQSFFSENLPMRGDIHHLFPTYEKWNNDRNNFRFSEIPDASTTLWERDLTSQTIKPTTQIEQYSEFGTVNGSSVYEPREDHKGRVARAVLYFFTVYPTAVGAATDTTEITSVADLLTLKIWHEQFPPNAADVSRNTRVEQSQGNRNFFVDNPNWIYQAWCLNTPRVGLLNPNSDNGLIINKLNTIVDAETLSLDIQTDKTDVANFEVFDTAGRLILSQKKALLAGQNVVDWSVQTLSKGIFIVRIVQGEKSVSQKFEK
jgi:hypothetical protein